MKTQLLIPLLLSTNIIAQTTLNDELDTFANKISTKVPPEARQEFKKGIAAVQKTNIVAEAKTVGNIAPDFTLKNHEGQSVTLSTLLKDGPVILTWYRGGWCPYCNIALKAMQAKLPEFQAAGATLVALTPELPDKSAQTIAKGSLDFQVLTDLNHGVAEQYGLLFKLTPTVSQLYKKFGNDLTAYNGKEAAEDTLPLAATYVIDTTGKITYAFLDANYKKRAEPAKILSAVQALK